VVCMYGRQLPIGLEYLDDGQASARKNKSNVYQVKDGNFEYF